MITITVAMEIITTEPLAFLCEWRIRKRRRKCSRCCFLSALATNISLSVGAEKSFAMKLSVYS